jgi:hypothetical protein
MLLLKILATGILGLIAWQDLKRKSVLLIVFPIGFMMFFTIGLLELVIEEYLKNILVNLLFVLLLFNLSNLYFSLINRKLTNIINNYFGMGDLLFLFILSVVFSPVNFFLFITGSLLLILLVYAIVRLFHYKNKNIPLAGLLSFFLMGIMIAHIFTSKIDLLSNQPGLVLVEKLLTGI